MDGDDCAAAQDEQEQEQTACFRRQFQESVESARNATLQAAEANATGVSLLAIEHNSSGASARRLSLANANALGNPTLGAPGHTNERYFVPGSEDAPNPIAEIDWRQRCSNVIAAAEVATEQFPSILVEDAQPAASALARELTGNEASREPQNAASLLVERLNAMKYVGESSRDATPAISSLTPASRASSVLHNASGSHVSRDSDVHSQKLPRTAGSSPARSSSVQTRQSGGGVDALQSRPISKRIAELCLHDRFADVYFLVGCSAETVEHVPAHRLVLASASPVFAAMFFGPLAEQAEDLRKSHCNWGQYYGADDDANKPVTLEIRVPDLEASAFRSLMQFVYEDSCRVEADTCTQLLYGAKKYQLAALEDQCVAFLKQSLTVENAFLLLSQARLFDSEQLAALCYDLIDKRTLEAMQSEAFLEIDIDTLCSVVSRDTLGIREVKLFECVRKWAIAECERRKLPKTDEHCRYVLTSNIPVAGLVHSPTSDSDRRESCSAANSLSDSQANLQCAPLDRDVLKLIRFTLMSVEEFANYVGKFSILSDGDIKAIFMYFLANSHNKPALKYNDQPRRCMTGREQTATRFCGVETRWGYSGTSDKIRFTVNRRIFVIGFGLYGSVHGTAEHRAVIQLTHAESGRVVATNDASYRGDGSPNAFRVTFREPVEVFANTSYIASASIAGPDSYFGTKGLRRVAVDSVTNGKVTFQFSYAAGCNNGTSVEDGQIPEIIFYV